MNIKLFRIVLVSGVLFCFGIISLLVSKIYQVVRTGRPKPTYAMKMNRNTMVLGTQTGNLRYFFEPEPNSRQTLAPEWLGYTIINTINSQSLNETKEYSTAKNPDTFRIIALGDSFTFGAYVNTSEAYPKQLEYLLNTRLGCAPRKNFEVINLGMHGYDLIYSVERFKKRGMQYNPDLVIWFVNDWNFESINEQRLPYQRELEEKGIPSYDEKTRTNPAVLQALKKLNEQLGEKFILNYQKDALRQITQYHKGNIILMSFPTLFEKYKEIIGDFVKTTPGAYFFQELYSNFNAEQYSLPDYHPNPRGHKKIAEALFGYLIETIIRECTVRSIQ